MHPDIIYCCNNLYKSDNCFIYETDLLKVYFDYASKNSNLEELNSVVITNIKLKTNTIPFDFIWPDKIAYINENNKLVQLKVKDYIHNNDENIQKSLLKNINAIKNKEKIEIKFL